MKTSSISCIAYLAITFLTVGPLFAQTSVWSVNSASEVSKGDAKGVSVAANGTITPAPKLDELFATGQTFVWSSAIDPAGNIYLGTGGEGRIYKISPDGKGALFCDLSELNVSALHIDAGGRVFAGTSPDGKIYEIDKNGTATPYFDPKEKYIWSIADAKGGGMLIGTGEKGKIFRVSSANMSADAALVYDSDESHIMTLAVGANGNIYAGTDPNGLVLRLEDNGSRAFALLDSPLREIHDIAVGSDGALYALAVSESAAAAPAPTPAPTPTPSAKAAKTNAAPPAKSRYDLSSARSAVYRIDANGGDRVIWSSAAVTGFSLVPDANGGVLLGTSDKGRIYRITDSGDETLLLQTETGQISVMMKRGDSIYAASSNDGRLFRFGTQSADGGTYESSILDAGSFADWGRIWWNSSGRVQIQTRSGNTEEPRSTWSDWTNAGAKVMSPPGRFLQWRAVFAGGSNASVSDVNVAYLTKNIAPEVLSLTILPANIGLAPNPPVPIDPNIISAGLDPQDFGLSAALPPPRKIYQRGAVSFQWTAEDRSDDKLVYDVFYKGFSEHEYKPLATGIAENFYTLDGLSLADGQYTIKVVARDDPSNTAASALSGERVSDPFAIDNSQPVVTVLETTSGVARFKAADRSGYIVRAEYSINGGEWQRVISDDGISDSAEESYTIKAATNGETSITLRVFDANGNVGNGLAVIH